MRIGDPEFDRPEIVASGESKPLDSSFSGILYRWKEYWESVNGAKLIGKTIQERAGIHYTQHNQYLRGKNVPRQPIIEKYAKFFGVTAEQFMKGPES
jgi:transcriptional regulator with XRE-family HTH domain